MVGQRYACSTLRIGGIAMPNFRCNFVKGGTYFFTCVTYQRQSILTTDLGRRCLREAILKVNPEGQG